MDTVGMSPTKMRRPRSRVAPAQPVVYDAPLPVLYKLCARSIFRKNRADIGRQGVWLILAVDSLEVASRFARDVTDAGEWEVETISPVRANIVRLH